MGLLTKLKGIFKSDSTSSSRSQQPDVLQRNGSSDDQPSSATSAQDRASYGGTFKDAQGMSRTATGELTSGDRRASHGGNVGGLVRAGSSAIDGPSNKLPAINHHKSGALAQSNNDNYSRSSTRNSLPHGADGAALSSQATAALMQGRASHQHQGGNSSEAPPRSSVRGSFDDNLPTSGSTAAGSALRPATAKSPTLATAASGAASLVGQGSLQPPSARPSNAGMGPLVHMDSHSSISSIISAKMGGKNMVFVEAPATIEAESDAVGTLEYAMKPNAAHTPPAAPASPLIHAKSGLGGAAAAGSTHAAEGSAAAPAAAPAPPASSVMGQVFRRVQRIASVPLLIDTNPLHHTRMIPDGNASKDSSTVGATSPKELSGQPGQGLPPLQPQQAQQGGSQQPKPKSKPRRHASLKHLLHLDNYDFVSDVNVAEAHDMLRRGQLEDVLAAVDKAEMSGLPPAGPSRGPPAAIGMASFSRGGAEPWRPTGVVRSPSLVQRDDSLVWEDSNILAVSPALPPAMRRPKWSVNDFKLTKKLHQGYASDVYFGRCRATGEYVVLKVYRLADQCDLQRVQLYREIRVHSRLQHQNIVQFYAAFLEDNCVVIVQEYAAGGDLLRYMYKLGGRLTERQAVNLVLQPFLSALLYLHSQGIIHRDIKPENCLLTDSKLLKLADFGLAVDLNEERANTRAGTLDYMAPEVLRCPTKETPDQFKREPGAAHYQMGADAWAVGVFAYELVAGGSPFKGAEMIDTARNIISINIQYPNSMSDMARSFVSACLRKHPGDRPTVVEMLHHPWITMFQRRASVVMPSPALSAQYSGGLNATQDFPAVMAPPSPAIPSFLNRGMSTRQPATTAAAHGGHTQQRGPPVF